MKIPVSQTIPSFAVRALLAACALFSLRADACTAFQFRDGARVFLAKNHDFMMGEGLLIVNPRGRSKFAVPAEKPFAWTSQHGSVTYNQFGREFPNAGMNEAGLVVEMLWLSQTAYAPADDRASLSLLQWIQYQLDTAATVADVLASDEHVRIADGPGRAHFFITDQSGSAAVIEWLDGQRRVYTGDELPVPALANDVYAACVGAWQARAKPPEAAARTLPSYGRFAALAAKAGTFDRSAPPDEFAFTALDRVKHPAMTVWQLVYSPMEGSLTVKRRADPRAIRVSLAQLDFSSEAPAMAFDLAQSGPLEWVSCTLEVNRQLVMKSYRQTPFLAHFTDEVLETIAATPELFVRVP